MVRSWELDKDLDTLAWSQDGLFLLATSHGTDIQASPSNGTSYVLPLDPDAAVTDGSDDHRGWVAQIAAGVAGLAHAQWIPIKRIPAVMQFSSFDAGAVLYSLCDQAFTVFPDTILPHIYGHSQWPNMFALTQKFQDKDALVLYAPQSNAAPSLEAPVVWSLWRSIPLHTTSVSGVAWSPDGYVWAVWDSALEFRVCLYTLHGVLIATLAANEQGTLVTTSSLTKQDVHSLLAPKPATSRARRVSVRTSRSMSNPLAQSVRRSSASTALAHVAGGGLGVRTLSWHPSSQFLSVGGYDEHVYVLSHEDWSVVYVLDYSVSALRRLPTSPVVWQEPYQWFEATQGRGIVSMESTQLPIQVSVQAPDEKAWPPKAGIQWLSWNKDGSVLACRNESMPTVLFLHVFEGIHERSVDMCLQPLALLAFAEPICSVAWKPGHPCSLAVVTGQSAVYTWTWHSARDDASLSDTESTLQTADAIAIPNDRFSAVRLHWSPDGQSLVLADTSSFCCVVPAPSEATEIESVAPP
ncbi:yvtn repeat-like quino protein amine dehydrogenase [Malassezia pachydermatis]|uniref:Yvtn repeat-like quino protein amine dehydrogenase n=1 Tax=Malassezia pachydermatis TaxID=77020 RepID=A0A0M9VP73_9BASI|nr:yvtn repeat-like quino protein amine dehydrogenase [Malassezia pachydermatis]KOS14113.1 yvtn repeat-like quino protein amine dehydrogenase [Malassezia pachydermatis]